MAPIQSVFALCLFASLVLGHGHIQSVIVDGVTFRGYDPGNAGYKADVTVGWTTKQTEDWSVNSNQVGDPDIICHKSATPAKAYATAKPGSNVTIQYNNWPYGSHPGPALAYIADCGGDCTTVDKTQLKWVKFWERGRNDKGVWITDDMVSNRYRMALPIPNFKPGNYVVRHELINLYLTGRVGATEMYPQCVNFKIEGSGTEEVVGGVLGTQLYKPDDAGLFMPKTAANYTFPGPPVAKFTFL